MNASPHHGDFLAERGQDFVGEKLHVVGVGEVGEDELEEVVTEVDLLGQEVDQGGRVAGEGRALGLELDAGALAGGGGGRGQVDGVGDRLADRVVVAADV